MGSTLTIRLFDEEPDDFVHAQELRDAIDELLRTRGLSGVLTVSDNLRTDDYTGLESRLVGITLPNDLDFFFNTEEPVDIMTLRRLEEGGITRLDELLKQTPLSLQTIDGFGMTLLERVTIRLGLYRLSLAAEPRQPSSAGSTPIELLIPEESNTLASQVRHVLQQQGIYTAADLARKTSYELLNIPNFGARSLALVQIRLQHIGLSLKDG